MILFILLLISVTTLLLHLGIEMFKGNYHKKENREEDRRRHDHKNCNKNHEHDYDVFGILSVRGSGEVIIDLCYYCIPKHIDIDFKKEKHHHPCNPHQDQLDWKLSKTQTLCQLIISYDVGDFRDIEYKVKY